MSKFNIKLYNKSQKDEVLFSTTLQSRLPKEYKIVRTNDDKHCNVDYIIYKNNQILMYLELKTRGNCSKYPSLMIGATKLDKIKSHFNSNCIIVWQCEETKIIYHTIYNDIYCDLEISYLNGSGVKYIHKNYCDLGMDILIDNILNW